MKYGRICVETIGFVKKDDKTHINYGDHLQNIIIKDLYSKIGIEDVFELDFNDISSYDGEYLILPINQAISHDVSSFFSPKIIPVFLGLSRDVTAISDNEIEYLRKYEPIGCRDEYLFEFLQKKHVKCYLNGCLTVTMDKRESMSSIAHPVIIDVPKFALDYIPKNLLNNAEYRENTFYGTYNELVGEKNLESVIREKYNYLKENASVVITSRMHVASPCIGMGIPVILIRNSIDYRMAWIDKYITIYSKDNIDKVDWNPKAIELEDVKDIIILCAEKMIKDKYDEFGLMSKVSDIYEMRTKSKYHKGSFTDYVKNYIDNRWNNDDIVNYSIWGQNDASEIIINYMKEHYPNAKLKNIYDTYKRNIYHGIETKSPEEINNDDEFVFVAGYTATDAALELFQKIGKTSDSFFVFDRVVRDNSNIDK